MENAQQTKMTDWFCDGIRLTHAISNYGQKGSFSMGNDTDTVRMHFGLKGDYAFQHKQLGTSFDLIGGHHNMMYSQGFDIAVQNKSLEIETFGIQFPKSFFVRLAQDANDDLKRFAENVANGKNCLLSRAWGSLDIDIENVIRQIIHCNYAGALEHLFLLSKTIELLVLSVESYEKAGRKREVFIKNKTDKEKIVAARDLVNERLTHPPSLSEVASAVGLNEYKLKRGFKEVFNNTVFGYLTEQRLNLANRYLTDSHKTSAEIAYELGYKTPQHFNNAFKKKFGTTPNSVRNAP